MKKQVIEVESGELGKRVRISGGGVTSTCPLCEKEVTRSLEDMGYMSYPHIGGQVTLYFTCGEEDEAHDHVEWHITASLKAQLEIAADPKHEGVYAYDDEDKKTLKEKGFG